MPRPKLNRLCSVAGCGRKHRARDLCNTHHARLMKYGDPVAPVPMWGDAQKFFEVALASQTDECVTWPFARYPDGRGQMRVAGKTISASRQMCIRAHGDPPEGRNYSAHSCGKGNEACVNPRHLRWATQKENAADAMAHGTCTTGEKNRHAILSDQKVKTIRERAAAGTIDIAAAALEFGVKPATIQRVIDGGSWKHLLHQQKTDGQFKEQFL